MRIRIGTRGSRLALIQARAVARRLAALGHRAELVVVRTEGDRDRGRPFAELGAFGLFVREIERALLDGRCDLAVHSLKDLPTRLPERLALLAVPERRDPADVLVVRPDALDPAAPWVPLARGARVGTASARRRAFLAAERPDLEFGLLRGNLPTRLARVAGGTFEATVLAVAGIRRLLEAGEELPLGDLVLHPLDPARFVPAPGQGAIGIEGREDDPAIAALARDLDDPARHREVRAERHLLARVEGGCQVPLGAWARGEGDGLVLVAALGREDGTVVRTVTRGGDPAAVAAEAYREIAGGRSGR